MESVEQSKTQHLEDGQRGEALALKHLEKEGWRCLSRNFTSLRGGEIDLIVEKKLQGDQFYTVAFVEVKSRHNKWETAPELSVTAKKRQTIVRTAREYVDIHLLKDAYFRFDVIAVDLSASPEVITHFEGAFDEDGKPY